MKQSLSQIKKSIREIYLEAEKEKYLKLQNSSFKIKKEWDAFSSLVIWEGEITDKTLLKKYGVEIHYEDNYPFERPKVYPKDGRIRNNRHQNPSTPGSNLSGDLCIFQDGFSDWSFGTSCEEIIQRATQWFLKYENGSLGQELAPPEIERYYSSEYKLFKPQVVVAQSLIDLENKETGHYIWIPTKSGKFSYIATLNKNISTEMKVSELLRLIEIVTPNDSGSSSEMVTGKWFFLNQEPFSQLPHSLSDLLTLINHNIKSISLQLLISEIEIGILKQIALCYKTDFDSIHWLFFNFTYITPPKTRKGVVAGFRKDASYKKALISNQLSRLKIYPVHLLSKKAIFRRAAYLPLEKLNMTKVLILGCGTIGSRVADLLTKSGIGKLYLADDDILKVGNVSRHILPLNCIGQPKAEAVKTYLLQRNPFLEIDYLNGDITDDSSSLWLGKAIQETDLVISCIGNDAIESWVNIATMSYSKRTLYCRAYAHATIGEILYAQPKKLCFSCLSNLLILNETHIPRPPDLSFEEMVLFDDADCGASFIPGSAADIDFISLHCAQIAVSLLSSKIDQNYWLVRGRPYDVDRKWKIDPALESPYNLLAFALNSTKSCDICGCTIG